MRRGLPVVLAALAVILGALVALLHAWSPVSLIEGVFWQPDLRTVRPRGAWEQIGAHVLVVQWSALDDRAWYESRSFAPMDPLPDWAAIHAAPWAAHIVLGLAARSSEPEARAALPDLADASRRIVDEHPVPAYAYYATVEDDPTWTDQAAFRAYLAALPRPLWVSVYTPAGETPAAFARWLTENMPADVTVLVQDGVGVGRNTPAQARALEEAAAQALGPARVALVVEAFRATGRGFRPARPWELWSQFEAYRGLRLYLFDGPHYLNGWRLWTLKAWAILTGQHNPSGGG
ncbi:MAG: alpha-amylase family protein [bacterium]